jgi:hypothetical protein
MCVRYTDATRWFESRCDISESHEAISAKYYLASELRIRNVHHACMYAYIRLQTSLSSSIALSSFQQANRRCVCKMHMCICMRSPTWVADSKLLKRSVETRNFPALEWPTYCDVQRSVSAMDATAAAPRYENLFCQLTDEQIRNLQCFVWEASWKAYSVGNQKPLL